MGRVEVCGRAGGVWEECRRAGGVWEECRSVVVGVG